MSLDSGSGDRAAEGECLTGRDDASWDGTTHELEVPVSAVEHYSYCPRQCALIHVEQIYEENVYTVRGQAVHERVDEGDDTTAEGVRTVRGLPLRSARLGLVGKADAVELRPSGPYPVEYKSGRRRGPHADLQLCAQALCLEEMLGTSVPRGAVYYHATRSRHEVRFDPKLRRRAEEIVVAVRDMLVAQRVPPPANDARCRNCSLRDACMPAVVAERARLRGLQGELFIARDPVDREELHGR